MTIRWDLPVETTETPPRPVRVLATDLAHTLRIAVAIEGMGTQVYPCREDGAVCGTFLSLRNVPAKPVRHEAWVNLYSCGLIGSLYANSKDADAAAAAYPDRVECRRIAWNSDGSPVEGDRIAEYKADRDWLSQKYSEMITDRDHWRAKAEYMEAGCVQWKAKAEAMSVELALMTQDRDACAVQADDWKSKATQAPADAVDEHDQMRPVVEAAVAWAEDKASYMYPNINDPAKKLFYAVRAYQSEQPAEFATVGGMLDGIIDSIRDAIRGEPVKNCMTCRWDASQSVCGAKGCNGEYSHYKGWEAKS